LNITHWLKDGDLIYLDDKNKDPNFAIEVIHTPGHTPDSIALYAKFENRIFIGDTICKFNNLFDDNNNSYLDPYTAIHLDCIGSNLNDYLHSLKKLVNLNNSTTEKNIKAEIILSESQKVIKIKLFISFTF
jgi:glyoxylase-like metal-dependent hydrolase (beta-lactamase superfamily II)